METLKSSHSIEIMWLQCESASLTQFFYYHEMLNMQKLGRWALKWEDPVYPWGIWLEWNLPNPGNRFAWEGDIQVFLIYSCFPRPLSNYLHVVPAFTCFLASYVDGSCPKGPLALQVMESWDEYQLDRRYERLTVTKQFDEACTQLPVKS